MSVAVADKVNNRYSYNIIITITETKSSPRDNQSLSKPLNNRFDTPVCLNEYETKSEKKNTTNEFRYFYEPNFVGLNNLVYPNWDADFRRFKLKILLSKRQNQK